MGIEALWSIQRLSKEEFAQQDLLSRWLIATRAPVLIITLYSCCLVGLFAVRSNHFDLSLWLLISIALLLAHATNNLLNDLVDWKKGVDVDNYFRNRYGTHPMTVLSMSEMYTYILLTGFSALSLAIYMIYLRGLPVLLLSLGGSFFLLFYTWPLKYIGLGEIAVFIVWGPLMIGGGYYTLANQWSWEVVIASIPYALSATTIIFGKHIDKSEADREKKIYTLPVILGTSLACQVVIGLMGLEYLVTAYLVFVGFFGKSVLVVFFACWRLWKVLPFFLKPKPTSKDELPPKLQKAWPLYYVALAFVHNSTFGLLFTVGLLVDTLILSWV